MIAIPEKVLYDFRAVARRAARGSRSASSLFHLQGAKDGLRIQTL
jgi:hypothetical protein